MTGPWRDWVQFHRFFEHRDCIFYLSSAPKQQSESNLRFGVVLVQRNRPIYGLARLLFGLIAIFGVLEGKLALI